MSMPSLRVTHGMGADDERLRLTVKFVVDDENICARHEALRTFYANESRRPKKFKSLFFEWETQAEGVTSLQ
jgi:hypothetical protein